MGRTDKGTIPSERVSRRKGCIGPDCILKRHSSCEERNSEQARSKKSVTLETPSPVDASLKTSIRSTSLYARSAFTSAIEPCKDTDRSPAQRRDSALSLARISRITAWLFTKKAPRF